MNGRTRAVLAAAACAALCLSIAGGTAVAKKKIRQVGNTITVQNSAIAKGNRKLTVNGVVQSSVAKCERDRSVLLYEVGPGGDFIGGAIGHGVSQGGAQRGQVTVVGIPAKKIKSDRRFRVEIVSRRIEVKGQPMVCKRGVSVEFAGNLM
jgi:type IV secretory pathway protease TraF